MVIHQDNDTLNENQKNNKLIPTIGDLVFKILVVGDQRVGKTSVIRRFRNENFEQSYTPTIGEGYKSTDYVLDIDGIKIFFHVWEIISMQFEKTLEYSITGASGALLIFDCSFPKTKTNLLNWGKKIIVYADRPVSLQLIGNKIDLRNKNQNVSTVEEGQNFARELTELLKLDYSLPYIETSAKNNINIDVVFKELATGIVVKQHTGG